MALSRRSRVLLLGAVGALLALTAIACAGGSTSIHAESVAAPATFPSPEEAVRSVAESQGAAYAGDCAVTRSPQDVGKICSKLIDTRGGRQAYLLGRTFSEFSLWAFVDQTSAGWQVAGTAPLDFTSQSIDIPWPN